MATEPLTRRAFLSVLSASFFASFAHCTSPRPDTLYAQSLQATLATSHLELLVYDIAQSQTLASTFLSAPIPVGSLLKPFLALAYLNTPHPAVKTICHGHADQCWTAHGALTLPQAIAQSCNAYFLALARTLQPSEITLPAAPPPNPAPEDLIGLTPRWLLTPETLVRAYAQLLASPTTPAQILTGMSASALTGTASRIGRHPGGVLAKTGTAPCIPAPNQPCRVSSDGLVLAAVPAKSPTVLLLARRRATTGALTAAAANPILTQLKALHAY
jgi:cell division protein FtsI/penicillin-binding protein 2